MPGRAGQETDMKLRSWILASAAACAAALAFAGPPPAGVWNIAPTGRAASSGDLHFRITQNDGSDPLEITVPVSIGAKDVSVARSIHNSFGAQLRRDRFKVELGEGANVLVSDSRGKPNFALELVDSDVDDLRVAVQSVTPAASPTVPQQEVPAEPPIRQTPDAPGAVTPPPGEALPAPGSGLGVPDNSTPRVPNTSPPASPPPEVPPPATPAPATPPEAPPPASSAPATRPPETPPPAAPPGN
jgi:hypothetical protein